MIDNTNNVYTEIEINAIPKQVWIVLTDWKRYPEWCSSMQGITTDGLVLGETSTSLFKNPLTGHIMKFEHVITNYEEGVKFGWSGRVMAGAKDHHIMSIEETEKGTTIFQQEDGFHGVVGGFLNFLAKHQMESVYRDFNKELKARVESLFVNAQT